jgi:hypothetical protein
MTSTQTNFAHPQLFTQYPATVIISSRTLNGANPPSHLMRERVSRKKGALQQTCMLRLKSRQRRRFHFTPHGNHAPDFIYQKQRHTYHFDTLPVSGISYSNYLWQLGTQRWAVYGVIACRSYGKNKEEHQRSCKEQIICTSLLSLYTHATKMGGFWLFWVCTHK